MKIKKIELLGLYFLMTNLAFTVQAAVYKQVDSNGNITYSDKPASNQAAVKQLPIQQNNTTDNLGISGLPQNLFPQEIMQDPLKASSGVLGLASSVRMMANFCIANAPASANKIRTATENWQYSNAVIVNQSELIMSKKLSKTQLISLKQMLEVENKKINNLLMQQTPEQHQKMCDEYPTRLGLPQMSLANNKKLKNVIMNRKL